MSEPSATIGRCRECGDTGRVFSFEVDAEIVCAWCDGAGSDTRDRAVALVDRLAARGVEIPVLLRWRAAGRVTPNALIVPPAGDDGMGLAGDDGDPWRAPAGTDPIGWHRRAHPATGTAGGHRRGGEPLAGTDGYRNPWQAPAGADSIGGHRGSVPGGSATNTIDWRAPGAIATTLTLLVIRLYRRRYNRYGS